MTIFYLTNQIFYIFIIYSDFKHWKTLSYYCWLSKLRNTKSNLKVTLLFETWFLNILTKLEVISIKTLFNTQSMVEPSCNYAHQRYLIDITKKQRIHNLYNFLIHNPVYQLRFIFINKLNQCFLFRIVFLFDIEIYSAKMQYFAEKIDQFIFVLDKNWTQSHQNAEILLT